MPEDKLSGDPIDATKCAAFIGAYAGKAKSSQMLSCFFGIDRINDILQQGNLKGIRINMAINDNNQESIVLFAVDLNDKELNQAGNVIIEYGVAKHAQ